MAKPWRDAASVLLFARNSVLKEATKSRFDYRVLMLRRSAKSKFMPNAYVFPGGVSSESDFSADWIKLFKQHGKKDIEELIVKDGRPRPMLICMDDEDGGKLPRDVAFGKMKAMADGAAIVRAEVS